jgi:hypothetical protein
MTRILVEKTFIKPMNPKESKRLKAYKLRELIEEKNGNKIRTIAENIVFEQNLKQFKERIGRNHNDTLTYN